jgi:hypothetical protein
MYYPRREGRQIEGSKRSLFEKSSAKTFLLQAFSTPREAEQKFFGYFFSKK